MAGEREKVLTVGEAIDGLCTIEVTGRGAVRALFAAARAVYRPDIQEPERLFVIIFTLVTH